MLAKHLRGVKALLFICVLAVSNVVAAGEASMPDARESLQDAWWTGPLEASSASTLPEGHYLIEPYLYDTAVYGQYDEKGVRHPTPPQQDLSLLAELYYGLKDRITIGIIPRLGFNKVNDGAIRSGIGLGDVTVQSQFMITEFREGWLPTISVLAAESLPLGRYDRLNSNSSDGFGTGAYTTTLSIYSQYYLWLWNGRILRTRLNLSFSWSTGVTVRDTSVYGTHLGFRGQAAPGTFALTDSSWEYSVTSNWVLAVDLIYQQTGGTRVVGSYDRPINASIIPVEVQRRLGAGDTVSIAPAVEYNWNDSLGIIAGVQLTTRGKNSSATVVPTVALNCYF